MKIYELRDEIEKYFLDYHEITHKQVRIEYILEENMFLVILESFISNYYIETIKDIHDIVYNEFGMYFSYFDISNSLNFVGYKFIPEKEQLKKFRKKKLEKLM